jgi:hypothetical protein
MIVVRHGRLRKYFSQHIREKIKVMGPVPKKDICSIYELVWNQQPHVRLRHMKNKNQLINK